MDELSAFMSHRQRRETLYQEEVKESSLGGLPSPVTATKEGDDPTVLKGHFYNLNYRSEMSVHITDTIEVLDHVAEADLPPSLTISLILAGQAGGSLGDLPFHLDATTRPMGYLWAISEKTHWTRQIKKDTRVRKVNVTFSADWLLSELESGLGMAGADRLLQEYLTNPTGIKSWPLSRHNTAIVEKMLQSPRGSTLRDKMRIESMAMEIVSDALSQAFPVEDARQHDKTGNRAMVIRDHIEANLQTELSVRSLGEDLGMAVNTLQRVFKSAYGMTVMDYVRQRRLEQARIALERDKVTITQAAWLAGYNNSANFATAFKRAFGMSPSGLVQ